MKAMILAAGMGTRLKPWTLSHPKALVPVGGVPMLERVIVNLREQGFDYIVVNVHHFADQILDFLNARDFGVRIVFSDETGRLLDTGGAIMKAGDLLRLEEGPVLIHNVDILSNADLSGLISRHEESGADSTLLVSDRKSSRKLIFGNDMKLHGWHHVEEDRFIPEDYRIKGDDVELAFSGIHVVGKRLVDEMKRLERDEKFSIIDFLLSAGDVCDVRGYRQDNLRLIDIGKPATLSEADRLFT